MVKARHRFRRPASAGLALTLLAILLLAGAATVHPPAASAQVFGCQTNQPYAPLFGSSCLSIPYSMCALGLAYGCSPYTSPYASLYGCAGNPYSCAGAGACGASLFSPGCNGLGSASCTGFLLQAGQSCANGVIACTAPPPALAGLCGGPAIQPCSSIAITPACQPATTIRVFAPPAQTVACPGGGYQPAVQPCGPQTSVASASTMPSPSTPAPSPTSSPAPTLPSFGSQRTGVQVSLAVGWNLISAPGGTTLGGVSGSLITFQAGDTAYETLPVSGTLLKAGEGYWLYAAQATPITLGSSVGATVRVSLPAGQFVMVGNPGITSATVSGADSVLVYDPATSSYTATTQLQPGQGAWAVSNNGGQATITNFPNPA